MKAEKVRRRERSRRSGSGMVGEHEEEAGSLDDQVHRAW